VPVAIDTTVLLPVIRGDVGSASVLVPFLDRFIESLGLVICAPVYNARASSRKASLSTWTSLVTITI